MKISMMSKLEKIKVKIENYYSVGFIPQINKYCMCLSLLCQPEIEQTYEISEAEYNLFGKKELDDLWNKFIHEQNKSERFLFSDCNSENTKEQLELRKIVLGF